MRTEQRALARERHWACAERLRARRTALGLTQAEVAQVVNHAGLDLTNRALSAMEHGQAPALGLLPDLAAALDCTTTYLLGLTRDPHGWSPDPEPAAPLTDTPPTTIPPHRAPQAQTPPGAGAARLGWILGPDVPDRRPPAALG